MIDLLPGIADRASNMTFSQNEIQRYSRHLIMPEVGMTGQKKLKSASILLIGAGGLGSPLGLYLAAAGIGRLGLVDFDVVDHSNLQRQVLHTTADVGRSKLQSAAEHLQAINPEVELDLYETMRSGHLAGAAIDVFEVEPLPESSSLRELDNVYLSPHNANSSFMVFKEVHAASIKNLFRGLDS